MAVTTLRSPPDLDCLVCVVMQVAKGRQHYKAGSLFDRRCVTGTANWAGSMTAPGNRLHLPSPLRTYSAFTTATSNDVTHADLTFNGTRTKFGWCIVTRCYQYLVLRRQAERHVTVNLVRDRTDPIREMSASIRPRIFCLLVCQ